MNKHNINTTRAIFFLMSLIGATACVSAQSSLHTLKECIDFAMKNNLAIKAGNLSVDKAENMQGAAFDIEKTEFAIAQDPTSGGSPDNSISLTQSIDFPTVYTARRNFLKAGTELERSNLTLIKNDITKSVTENYYLLLHARERVKILRKQDSICARFLFLANAKYKEGAASRLEKINAERLYNENRIALQKELNAENNALLALQRQLGSEADIHPTETVLPVMNAPSAYTQPVFEQTPWGNVYSSKKNVSERNLKLTRQGYMPNLSFTLKNQLVIKGFNPYNIQRDRFEKGNFMGFEVGVGIPIFFGATRAKAKAARNDMEIAEVELRDAELAMQKEYSAARAEYNRAAQTLDYYESEGMASADEMVRLSQLSYEKGEIDYVEYIQNLRSSLEVHLQHADAINDYNQAIIMLNYLQGYK